MKIQQIEISKQLKRNRTTHHYLIDLANFAYDTHIDKDLSEKEIRHVLLQIQCSLEYHADQLERSYLCIDKSINQ
jgi:hypothetical protein